MSSRWWYPSASPKAVVQIIHGMCEHIGRYEDFATMLTGHGYAVTACDLPGHGSDCPSLGYAQGDMWQASLDLIQSSFDAIRSAWPSLPVVVFGHSYGSFLLQRQLPRLNAQAFILSGSCRQQDAGKLRMLLEKAMDAPPKEKAADLAAMTFQAYNEPFATEGKNAWLSRDRVQTERYNADPLCGFVSSYNFYRGMYEGLIGLCDPDYPPPAASAKPVLLLSGTQDPVGRFGEGVSALAALYSERGYAVQLALYEDARHKMINELNRDAVYACILDFLDRATR